MIHSILGKSILRHSRNGHEPVLKSDREQDSPKQMKPEKPTRPIATRLDRRAILEIAGNIEDAKVVAIERSSATIEQLEEAVAWASGLDAAMGKEHHPLSGIVAQLYEILTADEDFGDERE